MTTASSSKFKQPDSCSPNCIHNFFGKSWSDAWRPCSSPNSRPSGRCCPCDYPSAFDSDRTVGWSSPSDHRRRHDYNSGRSSVAMSCDHYASLWRNCTNHTDRSMEDCWTAWSAAKVLWSHCLCCCPTAWGYHLSCSWASVATPSWRSPPAARRTWTVWVGKQQAVFQW